MVLSIWGPLPEAALLPINKTGRDKKLSKYQLLSGGPLIKSLLGEQFRQVINMQTVTQAGGRYWILNWSNASVAVIIAGFRIVQNANGLNVCT